MSRLRKTKIEEPKKKRGRPKKIIRENITDVKVATPTKQPASLVDKDNAKDALFRELLFFSGFVYAIASNIAEQIEKLAADDGYPTRGILSECYRIIDLNKHIIEMIKKCSI